MEVDEAVQEYARGVDECCSVYKVDEEYRILYNIEDVGGSLEEWPEGFHHNCLGLCPGQDYDADIRVFIGQLYHPVGRPLDEIADFLQQTRLVEMVEKALCHLAPANLGPGTGQPVLAMDALLPPLDEPGQPVAGGRVGGQGEGRARQNLHSSGDIVEQLIRLYKISI